MMKNAILLLGMLITGSQFLAAQHGSHGGHGGGSHAGHGGGDNLADFRKAVALQATAEQRQRLGQCTAETRTFQAILASEGGDRLSDEARNALESLLQRHSNTQRSLSAIQVREFKRPIKQLDKLARQMREQAGLLAGASRDRQRALAKLRAAAAKWESSHAKLAMLMGVSEEARGNQHSTAH